MYPRHFSNDSRFWGTVPTKYVKGRALLIYWSFDAGSASAEWPGYPARIRELGEVLVKFPVRTRWQRSLRLIR